ncbi:MAG: NUDIX hydrolase [Nitrososphaeria archaeon]
MKEPTLLSSQEVYAGKVFRIYREKFLTEKGETEVEVVKHRGAVAVLPILPDKRVVLERQFRYTLREFIYEVPAGTLEENERPEDCARRELLEETGLTAKKIIYLTRIVMSPGYVDETIHLFVAYVSDERQEARLERDEIISTEIYTMDQALEMIRNGKIVDAKTVSLLLLARFLGLV